MEGLYLICAVFMAYICSSQSLEKDERTKLYDEIFCREESEDWSAIFTGCLQYYRQEKSLRYEEIVEECYHGFGIKDPIVVRYKKFQCENTVEDRIELTRCIHRNLAKSELSDVWEPILKESRECLLGGFKKYLEEKERQ